MLDKRKALAIIAETVRVADIPRIYIEYATWIEPIFWYIRKRPDQHQE
jgi:hypothetical protein